MELSRRKFMSWLGLAAAVPVAAKALPAAAEPALGPDDIQYARTVMRSQREARRVRGKFDHVIAIDEPAQVPAAVFEPGYEPPVLEYSWARYPPGYPENEIEYQREKIMSALGVPKPYRPSEFSYDTKPEGGVNWTKK